MSGTTPVRTRKNVLTLGSPGDDLDWYAKAVAALRQLPMTDPTSWRYQAAVHGYPGHTHDPFAVRGETLPSNADQQTVLEPVPASDLVLPALAPQLPRVLRGDHRRDRRQAGRPARLGIALLELQRHVQSERAKPAAGVPQPDQQRWHTECAVGRRPQHDQRGGPASGDPRRPRLPDAVAVRGHRQWRQPWLRRPRNAVQPFRQHQRVSGKPPAQRDPR